MRTSHAKWIGTIALLCSVAAANAQQSPYYVTDGDSERLFIIQDGELVTQATTFSPAYPLYVDTNRLLILRRQGDEVREFNLDGTPTGNDTALPGNFDQLLDATTDGTNIYLGRCCGGNEVLIADLDFSNIQTLFPVPGGVFGLAYDPVREELLIASSDADTLQRYTVDGTLVGTIPSPSGSGDLDRSLAYESASDTFWTAAGSTITQFDRDGVILDTIIVPGLNTGNNWGGAFAFSAPPPSPVEATPVPTLGAYSLAVLSALVGLLAWRQRRREKVS